MMTGTFGKLYLVPNLLGATQPEHVLPAGTLSIVKRLKYFVVENTRTSRRVLSRIGMDLAIDEIEFVELDKHNARNLDLIEHLGPCLQGEDMGLMSEAGTPCVADPGALVVDSSSSFGRPQCHDFGFDGLWLQRTSFRLSWLPAHQES